MHSFQRKKLVEHGDDRCGMSDERALSLISIAKWPDQDIVIVSSCCHHSYTEYVPRMARAKGFSDHQATNCQDPGLCTRTSSEEALRKDCVVSRNYGESYVALEAYAMWVALLESQTSQRQTT